jgi:isoleucyl-tRNA synthetase
MAFKPVSSPPNFPEMEKILLEHWYSSGIVDEYLRKNQHSSKKFSFLDGPITANNPMGVHHAWGRTYKDIWQRYYTMQGYSQRYQNGFDCQGLWVEVEVEKELGFKNKKDIEVYGIDKFVEKCKERVHKYASIQTEQSKRLGYFMDWDNSFFTMSDSNNYAIWGFLKECWSRGWIYKGHDVVPWCPRCETAISQHEILSEDYKELIHKSIYLELQIIGKENEFLLIWTTTPWTLPANTVVAVDPKLEYSLVEGDTGNSFWVCRKLVDTVFSGHYRRIVKTVLGKELVGYKYSTPFDHLPAISKALSTNPDKMHVVVATDPLLLPISTEEGTGLVHCSTSTGEEDFKLGKKLGLPVIPAISDNADYLEGFGEFTGLNAKKHPEIILDYLELKEKSDGQTVFAIVPYQHRYPACWRCKTELVWKIADEWYIKMDAPDPTDLKNKTFRQQLITHVKKISWLPAFGLERELDWLKNMHDWLISKKNRYWGLALPIYECPSCHKIEVLGSQEELRSRAVSGWDQFEGHTPHKPWIDGVSISCSKCHTEIKRIPDVGNPWLDAGIVSVSTLPNSWFPADFITESFPGQFKNWFYSLIAMSTVLKKAIPCKTILGFASLLAEDGRPMHKSWGNSIEFNDGADKIGVDVMRWIYATQNPQDNLLFGSKLADDTRRRFHLILWNIYNFFVTYANIDGFSSEVSYHKSDNVLDEWIIVRLNETISEVTTSLNKYNSANASRNLENFVSDLSLWFIRRSRDRIGPSIPPSSDKTAFYETAQFVLVTLSQLLAPFVPFISDEIYSNLTGNQSVHLSDWPKCHSISESDKKLILNMQTARSIVEQALSARKDKQIKVRQPLDGMTVISVQDCLLPTDVENLIKDEVNIKHITWEKGESSGVTLDTVLTPELIAEGSVREIIRSVQELRKIQKAGMDQKIRLFAPIPSDQRLFDQLKAQTLAQEITSSEDIRIELL